MPRSAGSKQFSVQSLPCFRREQVNLAGVNGQLQLGPGCRCNSVPEQAHDRLLAERAENLGFGSGGLNDVDANFQLRAAPEFKVLGPYAIDNLLALGGDPPVDGESLPSDFSYAVELVELARELGDFSIGVAAFPEKHPRSPDVETDRRFLAEKLRLADFGITQFFWDADDYFRMVDDLARLGVDKPVLPGLMAFVNVGGLRRMSAMNDAKIPAELDARLDQVDGDPSKVRELAVETVSALAQELLDGGAPGIHLCTLNFSTAAKQIWANLGLG